MDLLSLICCLCGIGLIVSLVGMFALTASMHGIDIVAVTAEAGSWNVSGFERG